MPKIITVGKKISVGKIIEMIGGKVRSINADRSAVICSAKPVGEASREDISFISAERKDKVDLVRKTRAGIVICDLQLFKNIVPGKSKTCFVGVEDPRGTFAQVASALFSRERIPGVHPSAVIHSDARIGQRVFIGPNTYIGRSVIGDDSVIVGNTFIDDNVFIGKKVKIRACCSIGPEGFNHFRDGKGMSVSFPHLGNVIIEDEVEIGSNTCIDRGGLGTTLIRKGAIIGNLVYIAHNATIGRNAWIIANTIISGSTVIGDDTYIGPSTCVRDYVRVGAGAMIGMSSLVNKDIPDKQTWAGIPAREISALKKKQKKIGHL